MLKFFHDYKKQKERRQEMKALVLETKANLEAYYVMFQLGRLRYFTLDVLKKAQTSSEFSDHAIVEYARRLTEYNRLVKDYKDFEFWYNEDLERKNKDNGRILHQKKELAQEQFTGLEAVIKAAIAHFEQEGTRR
ncbi:MAG: hypothetical protein H6754_05745 [Candidatus Omnitrophica bacterium]|nr:hypothetical protein [Candidatus Omnitrophota bacterium]